MEAVSRYESILEAGVGDVAARARYSIAEAYQSMGEYGEAIKHYYQVSYYGADAASQWINTADFKRGNCYEILGQLDAALEAYERILRRLGIANPMGAKAQERIDSLRLRLEGKAVH